MGVSNAVLIAQPVGAQEADGEESNCETSPSRTLDLSGKKGFHRDKWYRKWLERPILCKIAIPSECSAAW